MGHSIGDEDLLALRVEADRAGVADHQRRRALGRVADDAFRRDVARTPDRSYTVAECPPKFATHSSRFFESAATPVGLASFVAGTFQHALRLGVAAAPRRRTRGSRARRRWRRTARAPADRRRGRSASSGRCPAPESCAAARRCPSPSAVDRDRRRVDRARSRHRELAAERPVLFAFAVVRLVHPGLRLVGQRHVVRVAVVGDEQHVVFRVERDAVRILQAGLRGPAGTGSATPPASRPCGRRRGRCRAARS